jgi:hypothetical protein
MFVLLTTRRQDDRFVARHGRAGRRLLVECLESRRLLSAFHRHPNAISAEVVVHHAVTPSAENLVRKADASSNANYTVRFYDS